MMMIKMFLMLDNFSLQVYLYAQHVHTCDKRNKHLNK